MKVSVVRGGGLAGITTTTTLDVIDLSPQDAKVLRAKVAAAAITGPHPRSAAQPDRFAYELTVDADGERRTLRCGEADLSPQLQELLTWIQAAPARRQEVRPPGRT